MKNFLIITSVFALSLVLPYTAKAATLEVPSQYSTIQSAIDASSDGDVINVTAGTYNEVINFNEKSISVIGQDPQSTIIDGAGFSNSVVNMTWSGDAGEYPDFIVGGPTPSLENFTVTGGSGVNGGGIFVSKTSPYLKNLIVKNNTASFRGGGLYIESSRALLAEELVIEQNIASSGGGIVSFGSTPTIQSTVLRNNGANTFPAILSSGSGGIYRNLDIKHHVSLGETVAFQYGNAPELNASNAQPLIFENSKIVDNNSTESVNFLIGPGQFININNLEVSQNIASGPAVIHFVSDGWYKSILNIDRATIADNSTNRGIYARSSTIWNESGDSGLDQGEINIRNSIFWNNVVDFELIPFGIPFNPDDTNMPVGQNVNYSIVLGGYSQGISIINEDPLFVDSLNGDYHLTSNSPAIDSGDPNSPFDPDGTRADMGAYPFFQEPDPIEMINDLIDLVESFNLQQGINNSLDTKLNAALNALDDLNENNDQAAINSLQSYINAVEAQRGNQITNEQADILVAEAEEVIAVLSF